jgi:hypothetical protein
MTKKEKDALVIAPMVKEFVMRTAVEECDVEEKSNK